MFLIIIMMIIKSTYENKIFIFMKFVRSFKAFLSYGTTIFII